MMTLMKKVLALYFVCALSASYADYTEWECEPCESFDPCCRTPNNYSVSAEYLFWQPTQGGMTYGLSVSSITSGPLGAENKELQQKSGWASGFRLGVGFDKPNSLWDTSLSWTSFHHTAHSSNNDPFIIATQLLGPNNPFVLGGTASGAGNAESEWKLALDIVEWDLGYQLACNECYQFSPYIGVVAATINQTQTINYNNFLDTSNAIFVNAEIKEKNNFNGIGPKLGMKGNVAVGRGFGIMGNLAASFYYGHSNNPVSSEVPDDPIGFPVPDYQVKYSKDRVIPALQGQVGVTWTAFCRKNYSVELAALYEVQCFMGVWRNQNSQIQNLYISDAGYENLMLNGFTGQLKVNF